MFDLLLAARVRAALDEAFGDGAAGVDPQLRPASKPQFGHFQSSVALHLGASLQVPPRAVAERIREALHADDVCSAVELAGPGFLNFTLHPRVIAETLQRQLDAGSALPAAPVRSQRVVVDYSSPNVAKSMHVGHLRSTVIGDALARVLSATGHDVVRQNHLGDWGTQFGMLIEQLDDEARAGAIDPAHLDLPALDALYRRARARFDAGGGTGSEGDAGFASRARLRVVALQSGDGATLDRWRQLVSTSLTAFDEVYSQLGAQLTARDAAGESTYNADLPRVVTELQDLGLVQESEGALVSFLPGFVGREGQPLPLLVRKSDGGYGYAATDLAAIRHRVGALRAERLVYVVDARQSLHFQQVFALARVAGWLPDHVEARHVAFGTVLGGDGRPFKTRSGATVALSDLLDEAVRAAAALLDERGSALTGDAREHTAAAVGIAAVKYADLSNDLGRDYVFDLERMVALDGDTGPYLQYAHARLSSLLARAEPDGPGRRRLELLDHPAEQQLALLLLAFPAVVRQVATTLRPHQLSSHLHAVAVALSRFYEACPVLSAADDERDSRLALCSATRDALAEGLGLLGITALDRM